MVVRKRRPIFQANSAVFPTLLKSLPLSQPIEDIDLQSLYHILSSKRVASGDAEKEIIGKYIAPICVKDEYGNYHKHILKPDGNESEVLWSCHTDTVHRTDGKQKLHITAKGLIQLAENQPKECLGADDGAGLWLMLEMIKENIPGYYIFHREEEIGRKGSKWLVEHHKEWFEGYKYAIAFDRRASTSVITHQSGRKTASDKFVISIAGLFKTIKYVADSGGSYTDTASYADIIAECTNLSVGYSGAHTAGEDQDLSHLLKMRDSLIFFDESKLVADRDPKKTEYVTHTYRNTNSEYYNTYPYNNGYGQPSLFYYGKDPIIEERYKMARYISRNPLEIAELLESFGYNMAGLMAASSDLEAIKELEEADAKLVHIGSKKTSEEHVEHQFSKPADKPGKATSEGIQGPTNKPKTTAKIVEGDAPGSMKVVFEKAKTPAELLAERVNEEHEKMRAAAGLSMVDGVVTEA